jgi:hypothetical protein
MDDDTFDIGNMSEPDVELNAKRWAQGVARRIRFPARSRTRPPARRISAFRPTSTGPRPTGPVLLVPRPPSGSGLSALHR